MKIRYTDHKTTKSSLNPYSGNMPKVMRRFGPTRSKVAMISHSIQKLQLWIPLHVSYQRHRPCKCSYQCHATTVNSTNHWFFNDSCIFACPANRVQAPKGTTLGEWLWHNTIGYALSWPTFARSSYALRWIPLSSDRGNCECHCICPYHRELPYKCKCHWYCKKLNDVCILSCPKKYSTQRYKPTKPMFT